MMLVVLLLAVIAFGFIPVVICVVAIQILLLILTYSGKFPHP